MVQIKNFLIITFVSCYYVFADRGLIPFEPGIEIFEPAQRAMIAWDGKEEILLLSTDVSASDSTMVLEILPLPSEPKVKKGDIETFQRAVKLINQRIYIAQKDGKRLAAGTNPPAEITFHEKIGAHNISVVHLKEEEGFIDWVKDYLKSMGYNKEIISDDHKNLILSYIDHGFTYYVFDIVTLNRENKTLEPIQYRFKTEKLFYPLQITKFSSGHTTIELIILTPRLLSNFSGIPIQQIHLAHEPITISQDDLKIIDEDMYELLKECSALKLRIWKIEAEINSFDKDLVAD